MALYLPVLCLRPCSKTAGKPVTYNAQFGADGGTQTVYGFEVVIELRIGNSSVPPTGAGRFPPK